MYPVMFCRKQRITMDYEYELNVDVEKEFTYFINNELYSEIDDLEQFMLYNGLF